MIQGWCPGALRPMQSGDGLLVRLRVSGGIVDTGLAKEIVRWSHRWGNGQIDLSARANLQLRGLAEQHLPRLYEAMSEWGLLGSSAAGEAVRNVISSPLAGLDPDAVLDVGPIACELEQRLTSDAALHDLPGKFGFAIDDGGCLGLDAVPADVRFVARRGDGGPEFDVCLAGAPHVWFGPCRADALVAVAAALAAVFINERKGRDSSVRRMDDLVALRGAEAIARQAGLAASDTVGVTGREGGRGHGIGVLSPDVLGVHRLGLAGYFGIGLPFGRIAAADLTHLASAAADNGARTLRLTPWRAILAPAPSIHAASALAADLPTESLILDPADPRCRVAACPGAPSCAHATTPVRLDAARLADEFAGIPGSGTMLHVSGCAKGCAHPYPAPITLVASNGRYQLVRDGTPADAPELSGLTTDQAATQVRRIVAAWPRAGAA